MSTRSVLPLVLFVAVVLAAALAATADPDADRKLALREAQEPLRAKAWPEAAHRLRIFRERYPGTDEATEAWVLESRALLLAGKSREALDLTSAFLEAHGESAWAGRMKSNAADCYAALKARGDEAKALRERVDATTAPAARAAIGALHLELADQDFDGVETTDDLGRKVTKKDFTRALASYRHALGVGVEEKERPRVRERIALSLEALNNAVEAVRTWNALLEDAKTGRLEATAEQRERRLVGRGRANLRSGRLPEARADLREALETYPHGQTAMEVLLLLGEERLTHAKGAKDDVAFEEGVTWMRRAILEHRDDERAPKAQRDLATAYEAYGQAEKAAAEWGAFVERFPDDGFVPLARDHQAQALARAGLYDEAVAAWERFLTAHPNHPLWSQVRDRIVLATFQKGEHLAGKKDLEGAVAAYRTFAEKYPTSSRAPEALVRAGRLLHEDEKYDLALQIWRQVAGRYAKSPQAPVALLLIATTLEDDLARLEDAVKAYEEVVAKHANTDPGREAVGRLERLKAHHLELRMDRVVGTKEKPTVAVSTRNIESLEVRVYRLQVEEYFRRKGTVRGVENLQLEVVKPDKTATWALEEYKPFALVEAQREVPVDGPGAYVVVAGDEHLTATSLFLVSDVETVVKKARGHNLFVWVFERDDQAPVKGARVLVHEDGKVKEVGRTNADGVWQGKGGARADHVLVVTDRGPAAAGLGSGPSVGSGFASKAYVYTDRPVYRPGQDVAWRAVFLKASNGAYLPPKTVDGHVEVKDARGATLFSKPLRSSAFGTFSGTFALDAAAPLGVWSIHVHVPHQGTWTGQFEVQEYRKPEFTLAVEPRRPLYLTGEKVEAKARLTYAFGAPVADAPLKYEVYRVDQDFEPSTAEDFRWYFQDDRLADESRRASRPRGVLVARGDAVTDDAGEAWIEFETTERDTDSLYVVRVAAQDVTRRWIYDEGSIPVTRRDHMAVVRADRKVVRPNQELRVEVRTVDALERPVARGGEVKLLELRREVVSPTDAKRLGRPVVVRDVEVERASFPVATGPEGSAEIRVRMPAPGRWRLRWRALDGRGALVTAYTDVEAAGEAEDPSKDARLVAAKAVWTEGDEAEVLLQSPRTNVKALLTYEGERVLDYRFVDIRGASTLLELPVGSRHAPNVFFKVAIPGQGRLLEAETEVVVLRYLQVEVGMPADAGPGDEVEVTVRTTDAKGKPVAAEVGVALVDETLYAIAADRAPAIQPYFYDRRRKNAVQTVTSLGFSAVGTTRETNPDLLADQAARRGDMKLAMAKSSLHGAQEALRRGDVRTAAALALRASEAAPQLYEARAFLTLLRENEQARKALARVDRHLLDRLEKSAAIPAEKGAPAGEPAVSKDAKWKEEAETADEDGVADAPFSGPAANGLIGISGGAGGAFGGRAGHRSLRARGGGGRAQDQAVRSELLESMRQTERVSYDKLNAGFGFGEAAPLEVRKTFADVAAWLPHVVTDGSGVATTKVTLPDNLTTWRAVARGVSKQALVGAARARVVARRELIVRIDPPRFLTQTDRLVVPTAYHNESNRPLDVRTSFDVEGSKLWGGGVDERVFGPHGGREAFRIAPGARVLENWDVEADAVGAVRIESKAISTQGPADAAEARLVSIPRGIREVDGRTGVIDTARGATEDTLLEVPDGAVDGATRLAVVLYPGLDAALLDALLYLNLYPYGCIEQTVHRFLPALEARAALAAIGSPAADRLRALDEIVRRAAIRIRNLQNQDGSFGWFRRGQGDLAMTAYALLGLAGAREAGVKDLDRAIENAANALAKLVQSGDENVRALAHYALASVGRRQDEAYGTTFRRRRDELDAPGLAWMALAAKALDRGYDVQELTSLLAERRVEKDGLTFWQGARDDCFVGSDREATGLAVKALLVAGRDAAHAEAGLRWLLASRAKGGFGTTKDTAALVGAASAWVKEHGAQAYGGTVDVLLDGKVVRTVKTGPEGLDPTDRRFLVDEAKSLAVGRHTLAFRLNGQGRLQWAARLECVVASDDLPAASHGLALARTYLRPEEAGVEGQPPPVKSGYSILRPAARPKIEATALSVVGAGDRVLVRVEVDAPRDLQYVLLEDPLPAGFEVLEGTTEGPFDWQERRDERQVFFASKLPKGKTVFRYVLQATHWGRFTALGTTAYAMYLPEVHGRAAGAQLEVSREKTREADAEHPPTPDELYGRAKRLFAENHLAEATPIFESLRGGQPLRDEIVEEIESYLLKAAIERKDEKEIVRAREALVRRNRGRIPGDWNTQREIAFAYHALGEFEMASSQYRHLVARGFGLRTDWTKTLTARGREVEGLDALANALREFPVANATADAAFRSAQRYRELPRPEDRSDPAGRPMDKETLDALYAFTAHYAETPLADPANYALVDALRRMGDAEGAASAAERFLERFPGSRYEDDALYFLAESRFHTFEAAPDEARAKAVRDAAKPLVDRKFKERGQSRWSEYRVRALHLLARVAHVLGDLDQAIRYYWQARELEDAREAYAFLTEERLSLDDTLEVPLEGGIQLPVRYRNVKEAAFKAYPVDLQVLFAVRKRLEGLHDVDLSGIVPELEWKATFTDAADHMGHEGVVDLPVEAGRPGAWLVLAKAGDHEAKTLVVKTDLKVVLQRVGQKVRVYVTDAAGRNVKDAYVTLADGQRMRARGLTDGRGVFEAPGVGAGAAVVVSKGDRYAIAR